MWKKSALSMPSQPLDQLSEREKALLRLLAQGHTVKSAAAISGDSVNAANKLLRSARRKLSVGSSREAARLLARGESGSHKNCDKNFGLADRRVRRLEPRQIIAGGLIMTVVTAIPLALLLLSASPSSPLKEGASDSPKVVATMPVHGSRISPGAFEMRITFDRPMLDQVSILQPDGEANPVPMDCKPDVHQSEDLRSFTQICDAVAGAQHTVHFGGPQIPPFLAANRVPAQPFVLSFTVDSGVDPTAGASATGQQP